ncbi:MAG: hypothetical protein K1Y02_20820 [Candidatus Hydrogenedentes bacterium]|nr:hypothetical protein [Candidatus Hydrogenedentota bacterium]
MLSVAAIVLCAFSADAAPPKYDLAASSNIVAAATGFFRTERIDGRWWLIDPLGNAYFIVGTDHISYRGHWCEKLGYAPYNKTVQAKYASEDAWAEATIQRLKDWGFNTLTAGHSASLRHRGLPFIDFLSLGASFAGSNDLCPRTTWTGFPNVFSAEWPERCDRAVEQAVASLKDDPWLIGYFLDNELEWFGKNGKPWGLFDEAWKKPAGHDAKKAWQRFLEVELREPTRFETLWGVPIASFDALAANTEPAPPRTPEAEAIARRWVRLVAEKYFETCVTALRKHDANHMVLGCRFAGYAPDVWDIAGRYCDVVSFNIYPKIDVDRGVRMDTYELFSKYQDAARRPMMVTEWSFPAFDAGLPSLHGAGMRVDTQAQRTQCFRHFQTFLFQLPYMVGSDYFMYLDEPALGISSSFPEDSNYGLVNEQDEPYPGITGAARELNAKVYEIHANPALPALASPPTLLTWIVDAPKDGAVAPETTVELTTGPLHIRGPVEGRAWEIFRGETPLSRFTALIHQTGTPGAWAYTTDARITGIWKTSDGTTVDMELSAPAGQGDDAARQKSYTSAWRFRIPQNDGGWFSAQCLWVKNTDTVPFRTDMLFYYLLPAIGGSPEGDESLSQEIPDFSPHYYLSGAGWVDKSVNAGIACWYPIDAPYASRFYKDENGGLHSDLFYKVDATLQPGETLTRNDPPAFFFSMGGASRVEFSVGAGKVKQAVIAKSL